MNRDGVFSISKELKSQYAGAGYCLAIVDDHKVFHLTYLRDLGVENLDGKTPYDVIDIIKNDIRCYNALKELTTHEDNFNGRTIFCMISCYEAIEL